MLKTPANQQGTGIPYMDPTRHQGSGNGKFGKNQWSGHMNDGRDVQMPQMPNRKGNHGDTAGPVTAKSAPSLGRRDFQPSAGQNYKGNPDKIQMTQMPNRKGNMC